MRVILFINCALRLLVSLARVCVGRLREAFDKEMGFVEAEEVATGATLYRSGSRRLVKEVPEKLPFVEQAAVLPGLLWLKQSTQSTLTQSPWR